MQNSVMKKHSANQGVFLLLLSFFTLGSVVTGVLPGQDSPARPRPLAAAFLSRSYAVEHLDLEAAAVQVRALATEAELGVEEADRRGQRRVRDQPSVGPLP